MSNPVEVVKAFIAEWAKSSEALHASHHTYFTRNTVWENVGLISTTGIDEAIAFIRKFEEQTGFKTIRVDMLAIAQSGNKVLTERIDRFIDKAGKELTAVRIMGIFELEGDKVVRWRDYFDTASLNNPG